MPFELFDDRRLNSKYLLRIEQANAIIQDFQSQGFTLTLRQLYYQFVAHDLIENTMREYKNLGNVINRGRMAGLIDWNAIEDRTRNLVTPSHWESPADIIKSAASSYRIDLWEGQSVRPEVWIEKEALTGIIAKLCDELDVPYFACRGYVSQSEQWRAGCRARLYDQSKQRMVILHLGDHDPSGIDMTRDNRDRLNVFGMYNVEVKRLALNMDQIEEHNPPPNPTKESDTRAGDYIELYGESSWELDALNPSTINGLIRRAVRELVDDPDDMEDRRQLQENQREHLYDLADAEEENDE